MFVLGLRYGGRTFLLRIGSSVRRVVGGEVQSAVGCDTIRKGRVVNSTFVLSLPLIAEGVLESNEGERCNGNRDAVREKRSSGNNEGNEVFRNEVFRNEVFRGPRRTKRKVKEDEC
jgi:hypothetical protein